MNRREIIASAAGLAAASSLSGASSALAMAPSAMPHLTWMNFSWHLQWLTTPDMAAERPRDTGVQLAKAALQIGYKAINLTVRNGGHVDPQFAGERLPLMVEGIRSAGVACDMITTEIVDFAEPVDASTPGVRVNPEDIVAAARKAGIQRYRLNPKSYVNTTPGLFGDALKAQLKTFRTQLQKLEAYNRKYKLQTLFQTFSGGVMGSSVWDFLYALEGIDPKFVAFNYDISHLFGEGARGSWQTNMRVARPYWGNMGVKDLVLTRGDDAANMTFVKAGAGLVPFKAFFALLLEGKYQGTLESQMEYAFNGVALGTNFWPAGLPAAISPDQMMAEEKTDLDYYKSQATAAGWTSAQQT